MAFSRLWMVQPRIAGPPVAGAPSQADAAPMQPPSWDDLRLLLAVVRGGSFARAAQHLGVDDTTVSRRLRALERVARRPLVRRGADGRIAATSLGADLAERAERMEGALRDLDADADAAGGPTGTVRLTATPVIANRVLVPALADLATHAPGVTVELVPEARDLSLTRREADLALRLARPTTGGTRVLARRIATLSYGGYVSAAMDPDAEARLGWITCDESLAHLPHARWLTRAARGEGAARLVVRDAETMIEAAAHGLGRALLPRVIAMRDERLRPVARLPRDGPVRELWLLVHRDQADLASVRAVAEWTSGIGW